MKIKLGKLPNVSSVRITISLPATLKSRLDRYAQLHSQTWEQKVDAVALVPHILEQYLANDRAFRKSERAADSNSGKAKPQTWADTAPQSGRHAGADRVG